jgi:hypothetical protein
METESKKYKTIMTLLRESRPELRSPEIVEQEVMRRILEKQRSRISLEKIIDFFFGWVYVGWLRRSLMTAAVVLVAVFIWQQSIIVKQLNFLSNRIVDSGIENIKYQSRMDEKKLLLIGNRGGLFPHGETKLSHDKVDQLLESYSKLQSEYDELLKLINDDPDLKKLIEEKAEQKNHLKTKL